MDAVRIALAVQEGYSIICATCKKFWQGRAAGAPTCTSKTECAGPLAGKAFHDYEGPISDFTRFCFVCGEPPTHALRHSRSGRRFGICREHLAYVEQLDPVALQTGSVHAVTSDNRLISADRLIPRRKPTLFERIAATERELAEQSDDSRQD